MYVNIKLCYFTDFFVCEFLLNLINVLFEQLLMNISDAMYEYKVNSGDYIIRQGDDGDNFYVVER